jgi:hypothetical protein
MPAASSPHSASSLAGSPCSTKRSGRPRCSTGTPGRLRPGIRPPRCRRRRHDATFFDGDDGIVACAPVPAPVRCPAAWRSACRPRWRRALGRLPAPGAAACRRPGWRCAGRRPRLAPHHALAPGPFGQRRFDGHAGAAAARVAHGHRVVLAEGGGQRLAAFVLVAGRQHAAVGDAAHVGDVVGAGMGGAVGTHEAGTVQREHHRQVLQRHIVDQLVVAALQEGAVDGHHRLEPFAGQAGGKGHGVLLGDADVVVALRESACGTRPCPSLRASPA